MAWRRSRYGLIFAGVLAVVRAAQMNVMGLVVAAVCAAILYFTKLNAYFLIFAVAALYAAMVFFSHAIFCSMIWPALDHAAAA